MKKYGIIMSHSTDSAIKTGIDAVFGEGEKGRERG